VQVTVVKGGLVAAAAQVPGQQVGGDTGTVPPAGSLAYSELLWARCAECRTGPYARAPTEVRLRPTGGAPILRS
jgi:hypothetical protein